MVKEEWNELGVAEDEVGEMKVPSTREGLGFDFMGTRITPSKSFKYLGIYLDNQLMLGEHVEEEVSKANRLVGG